jgi:hypothetical protein
MWNKKCYHIFCCNMIVFAFPIIAGSQFLLFAIRANVNIRPQKPIMSLEIQLLVNWDRQTKMVSGDTADDARFYKFPMTIRIIVLMKWKRINPKSDLKILSERLQGNNELRVVEDIPAAELNQYLAKFVCLEYHRKMRNMRATAQSQFSRQSADIEWRKMVRRFLKIFEFLSKL